MLQLHDVIYRLRFYSNSLIHILSLSNSHNNVVSIQKIGAINRTITLGDTNRDLLSVESGTGSTAEQMRNIYLDFGMKQLMLEPTRETIPPCIMGVQYIGGTP